MSVTTGLARLFNLKLTGVFLSILRMQFITFILINAPSISAQNATQPHWSSSSHHNPPYIPETLYSDAYSGCDVVINRFCSNVKGICDLSVPPRITITMRGDGITPGGASCAVWLKADIWGGYQYYHTGSVYFHNINSCPTGSVITPLGCSNSGNDMGANCSTDQGNPVNVSIGNKHQTEQEYVGAQKFPLTVTRTYNSDIGLWVFLQKLNFSDYNKDGVLDYVISNRADGKVYTYAADGSGGWSAPTPFAGTITPEVNETGNVTGWRYTSLDVVENYDNGGKLLSIIDRAGLNHTYSYTRTSVTVAHSNEDVLVYQRDNAGRISGFITPDNEQYTYTYDAWGNLASLTYPNGGGTRTYHYENTAFPGALTGITDANGDRFATWTYDAQGRAISSEHFGGAEKVTLDYTYLNDPTDPRTTATNALGKQTTYHFTTLYGVRKVTQVEGHPSANCAAANKNYTYDANGFMASKTDWKGNTTTYVRNSKGQELSRTEATGTPQVRTITTEWHPTFNLRTKVTEPDRETTYTYDASGNLLNQQIVDGGSTP